MSNFVKVLGQESVNMDLVMIFTIADEFTIEFIFINDSLTSQWEFDDPEVCLKVYQMLLYTYTTTLNP